METVKKRLYKRPVFFVPVIIVAIPALWLAWWLGSPLFIDNVVIEARPALATQPPTPSAAATDPPIASEPSAAPVESEPSGEVVSAPAEPSVTVPSTGAPATVQSSPPTSSGVPSEPIPLFSGQFQDADGRHHGSGDAAIYELADGNLLLRVENLDVTNGPDLHVFLAPVAAVSNRDDLMTEGYLDLGELKGNKGDQNYPILGDVDLEGDWTVVIYCVPFHVIFSTAPLVS